METLKPLINQLVEIIKSGKDVVTGEMPDVCKQIVRLYLWGNVIEIPLLLLMMGAGAWGAKWFYLKASCNEWREISWIFFLIPICIMEIVIGCYAYGCGQMLLKAILAPKVLILETLAEFVK